MQFAARIAEKTCRPSWPAGVRSLVDPADDDYGLTARELEILELLVESLTVPQIAERLGVSFHTVDSHTRNTYAKLHVRTRTAAVAKTLKERLI